MAGSGHLVDDGPLVLVEDEGSRIHLSITPSGTDSAAGAPPGARHVDAVADERDPLFPQQPHLLVTVDLGTRAVGAKNPPPRNP